MATYSPYLESQKLNKHIQLCLDFGLLIICMVHYAVQSTYSITKPEYYSLLLNHLSLRMLETLGVDGILIQAVEQFQRVEDSLVGVILIQRLLSLIDLAHIL